MKLKILFFCLLVTFFFVKNVLASTAYYTESLPKWLEMLKNGDAKEKKLALDHLWFLEYQEFRKEKNVFDPILNALKDKDASVREAAAACLKVIGREIPFAVSATIVPSLITVLNEDKNPRVRAEVAKALGMYRFDRKDQSLIDMEEREIDSLIDALKDKDPWVRLNAVFSLGELKARKAMKPMGALLEDNSDWRNKFIQQECLIGLRKSLYMAYDKDIIPTLMKKINDEYLKEEIIKTLGEWRATEAMDLFITASKESNERIRKAAIEAISKLPKVIYLDNQSPARQKDTASIIDDSQIKIYISGLQDPAAQVRLQSVDALGKLNDKRAIDPLLTVLNDKDERVRRSAIDMLANYTDERILDALIDQFGKYTLSYDSTAHESFLSIAKKTCQKRIFMYRENGIRYVVESQTHVPRATPFMELMVHPVAMDKLIAALNSNKQSVVLGAISTIYFFEDQRIEPLLIKLLDSPSADLRLQAVRNLRCAGTIKSMSKLITMLKNQEGNIRIETASVLGQIGDKSAVDPLTNVLKDPSDNVRTTVIYALAGFDDPRVLDLIIALLNDKSESVRNASVFYIIKHPDRKSVDYLIPLLNETNDHADRVAVALGAIGDKKAVAALIKALKGDFNKNRSFNRNEYLRCEAARALGSIKDERAVEPLIEVLSKTHTNNSAHASGTATTVKTARMHAGTSGGINVVPADESSLKISATMALGKIGDRKAVPVLIECLSNKENDKFLRQEAAVALKKIGDPAALAAIAALPEEKLKEFEPEKPAIKVPIPPAPPKREIPRKIPGYPNLEQ